MHPSSKSPFPLHPCLIVFITSILLYSLNSRLPNYHMSSLLYFVTYLIYLFLSCFSIVLSTVLIL